MMKVSIRLPEIEKNQMRFFLDHWVGLDVDNDNSGLGQVVTFHRPSENSNRSSIYAIHTWHVDKGDVIEPGQKLADVTCPSGLTYEVRSPYYGFIISRMVDVDGIMRTGQSLCLISDKGDVWSHRGGPKCKRPTSAWRHEQVAMLKAAGLNL
jgi:hypothetical protein